MPIVPCAGDPGAFAPAASLACVRRTGAEAMGIPRITPGLELVDDEGDLVVVSDIDDVEETVELEASDGDSY